MDRTARTTPFRVAQCAGVPFGACGRVRSITATLARGPGQRLGAWRVGGLPPTAMRLAVTTDWAAGVPNGMGQNSRLALSSFGGSGNRVPPSPPLKCRRPPPPGRTNNRVSPAVGLRRPPWGQGGGWGVGACCSENRNKTPTATMPGNAAHHQWVPLGAQPPGPCVPFPTSDGG